MSEAEVVFAADHPVFAGHFPGHPIVPGALLLAEGLQALSRAGALCGPCTVSNAKFLSPVKPGERVLMRWQDTPGESLQIVMTVGDRRVASASVLRRQPAAGMPS